MKKILNIKLGENFENRGKIYRVFIVVIFLLLLMRIAYLQVIKYEKYSYLAQKNRVKLRKIEAQRGNIYDKNGNLIVTNTMGYRLVYFNQRKISEEKLEKIEQIT